MTSKTKNSSKSSKQVIVLDHARLDPSHCLTDGLFRPIMKGSRTNSAMNIHYRYKDYTFWWRNYELLNITDQSVFLAVHRLAAEKGRVERVGPEHENKVMTNVREALEMEMDAVNQECLALTTSYREIARTMGISISGQTITRIRESLLRLGGVSFVIYRGEDTNSTFWKTNLFSTLASANGNVVVAINPMLSKALVGGQSSFINMREQRLLQSDASKRLHLWLSSWSRVEEDRKIDLDLLIPHVWGDEAEGDTLYTRRNTLRKAIKELSELPNWICYEDKETGQVNLRRPAEDLVQDIVEDALLLKSDDDLNLEDN